jgi:hypothetical protein
MLGRLLAMNMPEAALIKWLAQHLRYKALPEFIGLEIQINKLSTIDIEMRHALAARLPESASYLAPPPDEAEEALAKHSIIDISYTVSPEMLDQDFDSGHELLTWLGFVMDSAEERAFELVSQLVGDKLDDATDLLLLKEELEAGDTYLRLFLRDDQSSGTLLRAFVIEDACIANAQSIWLHRHYYW